MKSRSRILAGMLVVFLVAIAMLAHRLPTTNPAGGGDQPTTHAGETPQVPLPASPGALGSGDAIRPAGSVAIRGRVRDTLGGVIVGAAVSVASGAEAIATTDEHGEFVAWVLPGSVRVTVHATGYAMGSASGEAPDHFFDVSLLPASTITGRVVERLGATPVAGARVDAVDDHGKRQSAESAEDGSFHIDGLSPGRYDLEGIAPGLRGYASGAVLVGLAESTTGVIVELERRAAVTARVLEAATREPCPSGEVVLHELRLEEEVTARIETSGAVRFMAVVPGTYDVEVRCEGHARPNDHPTLTVGASAIEGVTWEVARGSVARGVVVGYSGELVPNARVVASPTEGDSLEAITDARGEFVLRGLGRATYDLSARASVSAAGADAVDKLDVSAGHDVAGLRLALGRPATITGNVVDSDGKPIKTATVYLSGAASRRVETRADGSFVVTGLPPGGYRLHARAELLRDGLRYGSTHGGKPDVTVAVGETAKWNVVIAGRSAFAEGRVVDREGGPLPDFFIEAKPGNEPSGFTRWGGARNPVVTDERGHFRIEWTGDGEHSLRAYRQGGSEGIRSHITSGMTDIVIRVASSTLTGVVRGAPGQPKPDRFTISADDDEQHIWRVETARNANGAFTMRELPPGHYAITIQTPDGTATTKVTMTDGANVSLDLALVAHVAVRGSVVWADNGTAVQNARISLVTPGALTHYLSGEVTTTRDGRFEFPHAAASTTELSVTAPGGGRDVAFALGEERSRLTIPVPRDEPVN